MFFRREKIHVPSFDECLQTLSQKGITSSRKGEAQAAVMRGPVAAIVTQKAEATYVIDPIGLVIGNEIGELVDGGNQKYWLTPHGQKEPAQADQLHAIHALEEDLREGLGMTSLYNEGLGSVNSLHLYDRVKDRDRGVPTRPWEEKTNA